MKWLFANFLTSFFDIFFSTPSIFSDVKLLTKDLDAHNGFIMYANLYSLFTTDFTSLLHSPFDEYGGKPALSNSLYIVSKMLCKTLIFWGDLTSVLIILSFMTHFLNAKVYI